MRKILFQAGRALLYFILVLSSSLRAVGEDYLIGTSSNGAVMISLTIAPKVIVDGNGKIVKTNFEEVRMQSKTTILEGGRKVVIIMPE